jgi:hypothetical protein
MIARVGWTLLWSVAGLMINGCNPPASPMSPDETPLPDPSAPLPDPPTDPGSDNPGPNETPSVPLGEDVAIPNEGASHVPVGTQVDYQHVPPASGSHWSAAGTAPVAPGVYAQILEEEQWVHNLEHGYVVILYDCPSGCEPTLTAELEALFDAAPQSTLFNKKKLVIAPYSGLPARITAIAWDVQLYLDAFNAQTLLDFYARYLDQGPEQAP